jgi:hypothetical protein
MTSTQLVLARSSAYLRSIANQTQPEGPYETGFQGGLRRAALLNGIRANARVPANPFDLVKASVEQIRSTVSRENGQDLGAIDPFAAGVERAAAVVNEDLPYAETVSGFFHTCLSDLAASIEIDSMLPLTPAANEDYKRGIELIYHVVAIHQEEIAHPEQPEVKQLAAPVSDPAPVPVPMPDSQRQSINALKALLAKAESGEIIEVCAVATLPDGVSYTAAFSPCENRFGLYGFMMQVAMSRCNLGAPQAA